MIFGSIMARREALASFHRHHCTFKHPKYIFIFFVQLHDGLVNHAATTHIERSDWRLERNNIHFTSKEFLSKEALHQQLDNPPDLSKYASLLQGCSQIKPLKQVQAQMYTSGFYENIFLGAKLVSMYAVCGSVEDARRVFDKMVERNQNAFLWNVMIRAYAGNGFCEDALMLYNEMLQTGLQPDKFTFPPVLKSLAGITALQEGKEIHCQIVRVGLESDIFVGNSLISMYAKCDRVELAQKIFDRMSERDVVSWNAMIVGYSQKGHANEALTLYTQMQLADMIPDSVTMVSVLQACAHLGDLQQGKWIHDYIIRRGFDSILCVGNSLIAMYAKCGNVDVARQLFDEIPKRDVVSWNAMIAGYAQNGEAKEALALFQKMQLENIKPTCVTMASALQACAHLGERQQGNRIYDCAVASGLDADVLVGTAIIDMYAKCGSIEVALALFDQMTNKNVVSWNAMISGCAQNGHADEALALFNQMKLGQTKPNSATMVSVLPACALLGALKQGRIIHGYIIRRGFDLDIFVETALIDMYAKCESTDISKQIFDKMPERNVVSWNAMIAGYIQTGHAVEALTLFKQLQLADVIPDSATMISVLQACASLGTLQGGKQIHNYTVQYGLESDVFLETALIDMYAKCGSIEIAGQIFENMSERTVVSWNAIIAGYAQNGYANEALMLFNQMQLVNSKPNLVTMVSVLPACAHLATLQHGKRIHGYIIRNAFESDIFVGNSLIDMYSKCGKIDLARQVFDKMCNRDVVSWNAIIAGYSMQGYGEHALAIFSQMQRTTTMEPNDVTFLCVLNACSHAGLVYEGWQHFNCMTSNYCISPRMEHYASMVDLLGRAEHLNEAKQFIEKMPLEPGASVWGALLGACRIHSNVELGEVAAEHLFNIEPENTGYYVLMSNIYAGAGRWNDVAKVRVMMNDRGLKKPAGYSSVEVNSRIHTFVAGGRSHPQSEEIYEILNILAGQMKEEGYMPMTHYVLHDVEDEVKEQMISSHSEKLAIACGLINTSPGTPIQITKNLRVCGDCHSGIKFISKIVQREILVRDANRFHLFKDGSCSCRDYW